MSVQHTPGPWMTESEYRDGSPYLIYAKGSIKIADLRSSGAEAPESDGEHDANAHLIAAAPELLAAAEGVLPLIQALRDNIRELGGGHLLNDAQPVRVTTLQAVIAKAKGGRQS